MTEERLGNIGVLAVHGFNVPLNIEKICNTFIRRNPSRMSSRSVLLELFVSFRKECARIIIIYYHFIPT